MYLLLALIGGIVGIAVSMAAFYISWHVIAARKSQLQIELPPSDQTDLLSVDVKDPERSHPLAAAAPTLLRWTVLDGATFMLFAIGTLILLADVIGIARDRNSYPFYHFGYLLCGVIFCFMGMLVMSVRLLALLQLVRLDRPAAPNDQDQPDQRESAEQGI
jgi:hypothetical protein